MVSKKSFKSLVYIITTLYVAFITLTALTFEASAKTYGDYEYEYLNGNVEIVEYFGDASELIIPSEIDGRKVTSIGGNAFYNAENLKSVVVPDTVTNIEGFAFSYCNELTSVQLPNTITSLGYYAFSGCSKLTSVNIPTSISKIEQSLFVDCTSLASITIPENITTIDWDAFKNCKSLTSVTIPASVTTINSNPFARCSKLTAINVSENNTTYKSVNGIVYDMTETTLVAYPAGMAGDTFTVPETVKSINSGAFQGSANLVSVTIPNSIYYLSGDVFSYSEKLTSINVSDDNKSYKTENGILFNKKGTKFVAYPTGKTDTSYTIPETVTSIGYSAFQGCKNLTSVIIPANVSIIDFNAFNDCFNLNSVTLSEGLSVIESYAFGNCWSLTDIVIPDSVNTLGWGAFMSCSALENVTISNNLAKIDDYVFSSCSSLKSIVIPDSVTSIGQYAFAWNNNLTSVTLSKNLKTIDYGAFDYCTMLSDIALPESVESIGDNVFCGCYNLKSIAIPANVTSIGGSVFGQCEKLESISVSENNTAYKLVDGVLLSMDGKVLVCYPAAKSGTSYVIPDGVENIYPSAFSKCKNLTSIDIPSSVTEIGNNAFEICMNLTSIEIPEGVSKISSSTFMNCKSLKSVTIPASVTEIGVSAFRYCDKLADVYYSGTEAMWNNIAIGKYNSNLLDAKFAYSATPPTELVSAFVDRLYVILLNRNAEAEGLADWTNRLTSGTATSAEIVYGIANSQEFANRGLSNEDIVETMYQAMLGRASDEGGKANWLNCLNSGMTVTGIINGFSGSQEFAKICSDYGIQAGAITTCDARDRNNGLTLFVSRMYTKALNRPYDVAGLNDWTNRYLTGEAKVSDIAFGFIFSPEFVGKNLSNSDYVDTLYRTFFNREPDEGGKADWMGKLANGMAREDVLNGFVGSQECINLVATFGI